MTDQNDNLDLEALDNEIEKENKVEKRIKDLSEKVRLTSEERDEKEKLLAQERAEKETLKKERDFLASFGEQLGKQPGAVKYQQDIKDKVLKGYSMEDAITAVLVSKGEYQAPKVETPIETVAGGSSATVHQMSGPKPVSQMTRDEKRAALVEAEARGDISVT